jgi:hypothetical protein
MNRGNMATDQIVIYQTGDGQIEVDVRVDHDTVWLSQAQMVALFGRDVSVMSRHIRNALSKGEIDEKSNLQKMQIANSDRPVVLFDDGVIDDGYEYPKCAVQRKDLGFPTPLLS